VSNAITLFLSVLISRTSDEIGKVQVATIAARVNIWASSDAMNEYPHLAATCAVTPHHARHKLRFGLQIFYVGACVC
jgi:hypothetical protein